MELSHLVLDTMEAAANNPDSDISTVRQAVVENRPDVFKKLIEEGEPIDETWGFPGAALHSAAYNGHTECVRLLANEVSIHDKDTFGHTALHHAAMSGRPECVRVLLEQQSCDVNVRTNQGSTPLMWAMLGGRNKECIKMLLEHGANTKMSDVHGRTALQLALNDVQPDLEVVKYLIQGTDNPPTLCQLARTKIRVHLADCDKFCTGNIRKLNIPETVKEYLRLTDLEDGSEEQKLMRRVSEILF